MHPRPIYVAVVAFVLVVIYHLLLIAGHGGNATALFYAGSQTPAPPALRDAVYQFPNSLGFDGQFYLYIAHDPLNRQGTAAYIDNPSTRWKRILFPGLAYAGSFGQEWAIPLAYIALMWITAFLGTLVLGYLCMLWGYSSWLGLGFLAIPATTVSLDRMMTDIGLVVAVLALLLGFRQNWWLLSVSAMALAPLARETGLVLAGGWLLWHVSQRDWRKAACAPFALAPFAAWTAWVHWQFGPDHTAWWGWPFEGIVTRLANYFVYPAPSLGLKLALALDYLGALGIAAAFASALYLLLRGERSLLLLIAVLYTLGISIFAKDDMWGEAYSYTRTGGPVAMVLALLGLEQRRWWLLLPMGLSLPRIAFQVLLSIIDSIRGIGT